METSSKSKIIAAVRTEEEFERAINSKANMIFHLSPDLHTLESMAKTAHKNKKMLLIFPPQWTPISPHFALASLMGQLKNKGYTSTYLIIR